VPPRLPALRKKTRRAPGPEQDGNGKQSEPAKIIAEECWSQAAGCRMRFLRAGCSAQHPPLLLIHGLVAYSFSWRFNLPILAQSRLVYAIDLPGLGYSERVNGLDTSLTATAARLGLFLQEQNVKEFDVLGTSHGGAVAMMLAGLSVTDSNLPQVRRMVLNAPVNPWSRHGRLITRVLATRFGGGLFRRVHPFLDKSHGYFLRRMYGDVSRIAEGTLQGYSGPLNVAGTVDHLLSIMRCWHSGLSDIEANLPKIAGIPTLLIWGARDRAVLPASAGPLKAKFRNAELVILEDAGHLPYEEVPVQFNRIVLDFLDR